MLEGKTGKGYKWGQINSELVGLAGISISRQDVMIKSELINGSSWPIQN